MDHGSFDKVARLIGTAASRRAALGALLGAGALGATEAIAAKKNRRNGKGRKSGKGGVSSQAVCAPPDHGVNRSNCTYDGQDFSGQAIHSSVYKNTTFVSADLIETDLSSSNARFASFRDANLCGADLSSSNLRNTNFAEADLTLADLHSSSCANANFTTSTIFCGTIDCAGNLRNDDCPGGLPSDLCCTECGDGEECIDNECVAVCDGLVGSGSCVCLSPLGGGDPVCIDPSGPCSSTCTLANPSCPGGTICVFSPCCNLPAGTGVCSAPCGFPFDCDCASGATVCELSNFNRCGDTLF